eukprot:7198093-Heterocapsa_arctica.AAC.1
MARPTSTAFSLCCCGSQLDPEGLAWAGMAAVIGTAATAPASSATRSSEPGCRRVAARPSCPAEAGGLPPARSGLGASGSRVLSP